MHKRVSALWRRSAGKKDHFPPIYTLRYLKLRKKDDSLRAYLKRKAPNAARENFRISNARTAHDIWYYYNNMQLASFLHKFVPILVIIRFHLNIIFNQNETSNYVSIHVYWSLFTLGSFVKKSGYFWVFPAHQAETWRVGASKTRSLS